MNEQLSAWLSNYITADYFWILEVFVVVFATLIAAFVASHILNKMRKHSEGTRNIWDDALFSSMYQPLRMMIWLVGLAYAAEIVGNHYVGDDRSLFDLIPTLRKIGTIIVFAWFLVRFISLVERNLINPELTRQPMDATTATAIGKLLRISIVITAGLVAIQSLGYSVSGVLAFGGIGGIAVGFAAKDLLANFFGGLMIYLDRPFSVGDWVRSPDRNIEGVVETIGWRLTCIRTFDKRPLYVPNAMFAQIAVENPSRMTNRRIYETLGIRYEDISHMAAIVSDVKSMLRAHPEIDQNQALIVNFNAFAASSVDFFVYTLTKTTDWVKFHEIKQDVLLKIIAIIESYGAEMAYPTSTVHFAEPLASLDLQKD